MKDPLTKHCQMIWLVPGANTPLARPRRKQANVSVRMAWISFGTLYTSLKLQTKIIFETEFSTIVRVIKAVCSAQRKRSADPCLWFCVLQNDSLCLTLCVYRPYFESLCLTLCVYRPYLDSLCLTLCVYRPYLAKCSGMSGHEVSALTFIPGCW